MYARRVEHGNEEIACGWINMIYGGGLQPFAVRRHEAYDSHVANRRRNAMRQTLQQFGQVECRLVELTHRNGKCITPRLLALALRVIRDKHEHARNAAIGCDIGHIVCVDETKAEVAIWYPRIEADAHASERRLDVLTHHLVHLVAEHVGNGTPDQFILGAAEPPFVRFVARRIAKIRTDIRHERRHGVDD
jgi:hypothetical protein